MTKFSIVARNCKVLHANLRAHYVIWMPVDESARKEPLVPVNVTGIHELYTDVLDDDEYRLCSKADSFDRFVTELISGSMGRARTQSGIAISLAAAPNYRIAARRPPRDASAELSSITRARTRSASRVASRSYAA